MKSKFWVFLTLMIIATMVLTSCAPQATATTAPEPTKAPEVKVEPTKAAVKVEPTKAAVVEPTKAPVAEAPAAAGVTKVTIFVGFGTGTSPEQQEVHKQIQEKFNTSHKDIQIEFLTVPWAERITKFSTMLAGDMTPDLVMPIGVGGIAEFYDEWADLTPYIQKDNYDMSRFIGKTTEIHNYGERGVLGLPMCVYPAVTFYNKDLFDAAGVEYPPHKFGEAYADGSPWDYNKVVEIGKKLSLDANGNDADSPAFDGKNMKQWGWDGWDWFNNVEFSAKFGDESGNLVSADKKKSLLTSPQYIDAMNFYKDTMWTWHITPTGEQSGVMYTNSGDPFGSGIVGMWEIHSWMKYAWPNWDKAFSWDIAAVPQGPNGKIIAMVDADTFVMPKSAKHKDQAWEVIKWFYENENLQTLIDNYGCFPADKELANSWVATTAKTYPNLDLQVIIDALDYVEKVNHESWRPQYTKGNDIVAKAKGEISSGTNLDVTAVMTAADKEYQSLLDEYWKSK